MSDFNGAVNDVKGKIDKMSGNPFFTFAKPYLDFNDKGKIFWLIYTLMAVANLIIPIVLLFGVFAVFKHGAKYIFAYVFSWLTVAFACWIGFQIWWERKKKLSAVEQSDIVVMVFFADLLKTAGEWAGTMIGIMGFGIGLFASIFLGRNINYMLETFGLGFMQFGAAVILIGPIIGVSIIVLSRFLAEEQRLIASLVNNTKEIATNCKR